MTTTTLEIKTCDVCGSKVNEFAVASYKQPYNCIRKLTIGRCNGEKDELDVCQECSGKLLAFISRLKGAPI